MSGSGRSQSVKEAGLKILNIENGRSKSAKVDSSKISKSENRPSNYKSGHTQNFKGLM